MTGVPIRKFCRRMGCAARGNETEEQVVEIKPTGKVLGAVVHGADLSKPLNEKDFGVILGALGRHGVICIPGQQLEAGR